MTILKYPIVCFDLDGTLVDNTVYIWKTLHETFSTDLKRRAKAHDDYFQGAITYRQWFEHDLLLLVEAGATRDRIMETLDRLQPMPGAREILEELKLRGHKLAIVSGSLDIVVNHLFDPKTFDHILINTLRFDEDGLIAGGEPTPYDLGGKAEGLKEIARREGLSTAETAFVGDNENDVWIAREAGLSIAFNCKSDALRQICNEEVFVKDLRAIGPLIC